MKTNYYYISKRDGAKRLARTSKRNNYKFVLVGYADTHELLGEIYEASECIFAVGQYDTCKNELSYQLKRYKNCEWMHLEIQEVVV